MITRVVKMQFDNYFIADFKLLFKGVKPFIASCEGCLSVSLLQHEQDETIFFTISKWRSAEDLENYRQSELFVETWKKVKPNFSIKAEAWSLLEQ